MELKIDSDDWLVLQEKIDALKKLSREQLIAHLSIQGWVPVEGVREALQRGTDRVHMVEYDRGLAVKFYRHFEAKKRYEVPWHTIPTARLQMMAQRIVEADHANG